jgi:hypothetical protein
MRNADEIEDIWQTAFTSTYWRLGVDANNAMAANDGALVRGGSNAHERSRAVARQGRDRGSRTSSDRNSRTHPPAAACP